MKSLAIIVLIILLQTSVNQANSLTLVNQTTKQSVPTLSTDTTFTFNGCQEGKIPTEWSQHSTGKGNNTDWKVITDNSNKVLAQLSSDNPGSHFNVIVFDGFKVKNAELTVKMKSAAGNEDRGGGFIWRFIDNNNYYVVRANPLEDNVVLYKVKDGVRTDLPVIGKKRSYGINVKSLGDGWNKLKVTFVGSLFTVYLNDKQIFQVKDKTFTKSGKIGLWTKADAVSSFDDFKVKRID